MKNNNYIQAIPIKDNVNDTFGEIDSDGFFAKNVAEQMLKSDASITEDIVTMCFQMLHNFKRVPKSKKVVIS